MRVTRTVQISIFEKFSEHEYGAQLKHLSAILDQHPQLVDIVSHDLVDPSLKATGRIGLSAESTLRCMILKQQFGLSYECLAFGVLPFRFHVISCLCSPWTIIA